MMREDDFASRRGHLVDLSEEELEKRFWRLAEEIIDPLLDLASTHTSPSIERSVLLRMGFNSLEAKELVSHMEERDLLGHGAGHILYVLAKDEGIDVLEAGRALLHDQLWDRAEERFGGGDLR